MSFRFWGWRVWCQWTRLQSPCSDLQNWLPEDEHRWGCKAVPWEDRGRQSFPCRVGRLNRSHGQTDGTAVLSPPPSDQWCWISRQQLHRVVLWSCICNWSRPCQVLGIWIQGTVLETGSNSLGRWDWADFWSLPFPCWNGSEHERFVETSADPDQNCRGTEWPGDVRSHSDPARSKCRRDGNVHGEKPQCQEQCWEMRWTDTLGDHGHLDEEGDGSQWSALTDLYSWIRIRFVMSSNFKIKISYSNSISLFCY